MEFEKEKDFYSNTSNETGTVSTSHRKEIEKIIFYQPHSSDNGSSTSFFLSFSLSEGGTLIYKNCSLSPTPHIDRLLRRPSAVFRFSPSFGETGIESNKRRPSSCRNQFFQRISGGDISWRSTIRSPDPGAGQFAQRKRLIII